MIRLENWETIIKSHRYSRKEYKNGSWRYYYNKHDSFSRMTRCKSDTLKINSSMNVKDIVSIAEDYIKNTWISDWKNHPEKSICRELKGKSICFEKISYEHIGKAGKNSTGRLRLKKDIINHVKYLPCAKEILEGGGVHTQSRYQAFDRPTQDGVTGIVYQTVSGMAPEGDVNKYVQVTVSQKKYKNGVLGNTVYISVMGTSGIKKSLPCDRDSGNFSACPIDATGQHFLTSSFSTASISVSDNSIPVKSAIKKSLFNNRDFGNKSVEITISDITEGNKEKKLMQLAKALDCISQGKKPKMKRIKADGTARLPNIDLKIKRIELERITKALSGTAMILKSTVPVKGEAFTFQCHKDMMARINSELSQLSLKTYHFVQVFLGLPEITTMSKAEMRWKGKLIYSPETGKPITQKEWKAFVEALEKFMNRNYSGLGERWTLSAEAMGRLLDRMVKYQSFDIVTQIPLERFKYGNKAYDWISDSVKNLKTAMGESVTREQQARIEVMQQSAAQRVTNVTDSTRNRIQQIIIDGVRDRKSKTQVSQDLFDSCASMNRDMQRIADTEYQMAMNRAYIAEEVHDSEEGERVYFKRFEVLDDNTCNTCKKLKGVIAVWSNVPLPNERVKDEYATYAIWDGKTEGEAPVDVVHPWCRGSWIRWSVPARETSRIDAFSSYMAGLKDNWDKATAQAKKEWVEKGVSNPTDKTPGYTDRVREIYNNLNKK